jgi:hypothetical protein
MTSMPRYPFSNNNLEWPSFMFPIERNNKMMIPSATIFSVFFAAVLA